MTATHFDKQQAYEKILQRAEAVLSGDGDRDQKLMNICKLLESEIPYFDWVGFYIVDPESPRELVLGPYVGAETDHTRIGFGTGICGQAAEREETFVIQDVSKEDNYLACSLTVKSEIVVPVFKNGAIIGELDIDSHVLEPFTPADKQYLEMLCKSLENIF
ncbi:MAG: GAF domain-containing protein [Calditrichaeota bacterium]|nr:GAF domain-containing protein [Calditrichota bacterium]MCB9070339.1 GAF domain-containing protein [Calditrichia bacterium]